MRQALLWLGGGGRGAFERNAHGEEVTKSEIWGVLVLNIGERKKIVRDKDDCDMIPPFYIYIYMRTCRITTKKTPKELEASQD